MPTTHAFHKADSALICFAPQAIHIDETFYTFEVTRLINSKNARIWNNALGNPDKLIRNGTIDEAMTNLLTGKANIKTDKPKKILAYLY